LDVQVTDRRRQTAEDADSNRERVWN